MSTAQLKQTTLPVSSPYGWRILKKTGNRNLHKGTDFPFGKTVGVSAFGSGRVTHAGWGKGANAERGIYVEIEHAPGISTSYHSLSGIAPGITVGKHVNMGDILGYGGTTASGATGSHVHVGLWLNGSHVNLEDYLVPGQIVTVSNTGSTAGGGATPFPNTPSTSAPAETIRLEDRMIRIQSPGRGLAIIGPGYFYHLRTNEEVTESASIIEKHLNGNDRQFDLWVQVATGGNPADAKQAITDGVTTIRNDIAYVHDKSPNSVKSVNEGIAAAVKTLRDDIAYIHDKSDNSLKAINTGIKSVAIDPAVVEAAIAAALAKQNITVSVDNAAVAEAVVNELHNRTKD